MSKNKDQIVEEKCDVCGATRSASGKPFTPTTLMWHKRRSHRALDGGKELRCPICGAAESVRGRRFQTNQDLQTHLRKAHPDKAATRRSVDTKTARPKAKSKMQNGHGRLGARVLARFCPSCGCNLDVVNAAMRIVNEGIVER